MDHGCCVQVGSRNENVCIIGINREFITLRYKSESYIGVLIARETIIINVCDHCSTVREQTRIGDECIR